MRTASHRQTKTSSTDRKSAPSAREFDPVDYVRRMLGVNAAIVWERIRWWVQYNEASGDLSHYHNGYWWSWNSYDLWTQDKEIAKHGLTKSQFQTAVRQLKGLGVLVVERHRRYGKLFGFYRTIEPVGCGITQQKQAEQPQVREPDQKAMIMGYVSPKSSSIKGLHSKIMWTQCGRDAEDPRTYIQSNSLPPYQSASESPSSPEPKQDKNLKERQATNYLKDMNTEGELVACLFLKKEEGIGVEPKGEAVLAKASSALDLEPLPREPQPLEPITQADEVQKVQQSKAQDQAPTDHLWQVMVMTGEDAGLTRTELRSLYRTADCFGCTPNQWMDALNMAIARKPKSVGALLHTILKHDDLSKLGKGKTVCRALHNGVKAQIEALDEFCDTAALSTGKPKIGGRDTGHGGVVGQPFEWLHRSQGGQTLYRSGVILQWPVGDKWEPRQVLYRKTDAISLAQTVDEWEASIRDYYNVVEDEQYIDPLFLVHWRNGACSGFSEKEKEMIANAAQNIEYWSGRGKDARVSHTGSVAECYPKIARAPAYLWCPLTGIRAYVWDEPEEFRRKVLCMAESHHGYEFEGRTRYCMPAIVQENV